MLMTGDSLKKAELELAKTGALLVAEESAARGGLGGRILAACADRGIVLRGARLLDLGSGIVTHGSVAELRAMLSLDAAGIAAALGALRREDTP